MYTVFKIVSDRTQYVYYGMTKQKVYEHMCFLRYRYKKYLDKGILGKYRPEFAILQYNDNKIVQIQKFEKKEDASLIVNKAIENAKYALNNRQVNVSKTKEYQKKYYEQHKEKIIKQIDDARKIRRKKAKENAFDKLLEKNAPPEISV